MNKIYPVFTGALLALGLAHGAAIAGPGHDHGDEAQAVAGGPASPRFEMHSTLFEAAGVLHANELSVFIDRYADNAPVLDARVELESGATKAVGQFHADLGDYSFPAEPFSKAGRHALTLTVTTDGHADKLSGELVVPDTHAEQGHHHSHLLRTVALAALGVAALAASVLGIRRRQTRRKTGGLK